MKDKSVVCNKFTNSAKVTAAKFICPVIISTKLLITVINLKNTPKVGLAIYMIQIDNKKIKKYTDWKSEISFRNGLELTYSWIEKNSYDFRCP